VIASSQHALMVRVRFAREAYSGGELGAAEPVPSPARLHAAFTAAATASPWAEAVPVEEGRGAIPARKALVARRDHAAAVRWLEENKPLGLIAPAWQTNVYAARRYRLRAAPQPHLKDTQFEPFAALRGPVTYVWPAPPDEVLAVLSLLAREVTHLGRAEGVVVVSVERAVLDPEAAGWLARTEGGGPGLALRTATTGRFDALVKAHWKSLQRGGGYGAGDKGKQATDAQPFGAGDLHTRLYRFTAATPPRWPYGEVWEMPISRGLDQMLPIEHRVRFAIAVHRALVARIGDDVPPFVTGRQGDGPLQGAGHLAIHLMRRDHVMVALGVPSSAGSADRARLLEALSGGLTVTFARRRVRLEPPAVSSAVRFWEQDSGLLATEVPIVLDAPGVPRASAWSLEDAVICSVGYALRGPLEADGIAWGSGWAFRRRLVELLRDRGVRARARRVAASAARFCHRARAGDLLVAVDALVDLGDLGTPRSFLALGRARHLGGGLLRPLEGAW